MLKTHSTFTKPRASNAKDSLRIKTVNKQKSRRSRVGEKNMILFSPSLLHQTIMLKGNHASWHYSVRDNPANLPTVCNVETTGISVNNPLSFSKLASLILLISTPEGHLTAVGFQGKGTIHLNMLYLM